jgi:hypothetical protein
LSSDIILSTNVIIFLFLESIILLLQFISFFYIIHILKNWNFKSTSYLQYNLEKKSYLITLIIYFTISIKLFLLPFFIYTIDTLSNIITGAMCGAGVIDLNNYGENLVILKILILFFGLFWLVINNEDIKQKNFPFLKRKLYYFIFIFFLINIEFYLDIKYFINISTESITQCCSTIYNTISTNPLPFSISIQYLLIVFFTIFILSFLSNISNLKQKYLISALLNLLLLYISYYAIVYFFGIYIYQLPTHNCPFCMLQKDYYYIGYIIFIFIFLGTFFGIINLILKLLIKNTIKKYYILSNIFNTIYILILILYVIVFYIKNGVFF